MRYSTCCGVLIAALGAGGCDNPSEVGPGPQRDGGGRYFGIGIYPAGELWPSMVSSDRAANEAAATRADDSQIIVVVDSLTGEVRQCGDLSGYCIGMNPWTGAPGSAAPVKLTVHAADLAREAGDSADADPAVNAAEEKPKPKD